MARKNIRMLVCAVLAAGFTTFGTAAHAVLHSLPFDPPDTFLGFVNVDIPASCLIPSNDTHSCLIDFLAVDFTDDFGNHWVTGTPFTESDLINIDNGGNFFALQATLGSPFLALASDSNGCDGTQQLSFELPGEGNSFTRRVSFSCAGVVDGNVGTYRVVPEPAPLALLGIALAGIALSRRRGHH